jgi:uncharacterized repeat protein (TIGR01451 family)
LPVNATLTCPISVVMPGTAGGTDTTQTTVGVTGTTNASNDNVTTNNTATTVISVIDAVNDSGTVGSIAGGTIALIGNDTVGAAAASLSGTPNIGTPTITSNGGLTGATINATGQLVVPPNTTPGTYTVTYQICSNPAATPAACDTATVSVTVNNTAADMSVAITGIPATASPGASLTGSVVCTNTGPASATAATCTASAGTPAGATVTVTGACVASAGSAASLPVNATLTCPISVVMPGTAGGTDTTQTTVGVTGTTNASNDLNNLNNATTLSINLIDAINDTAPAPIVGFTGGTAITNVLGNDQVGVNLATSSSATLVQTVTTNPGVTLNPATGAVVVAPSTPAGTYTVTYQICANPAVTPAACDTATATVTVSAAPIDAVNDVAPAPITGASGGSAITNVLVNDTLNGQPVSLPQVNLTQTATTNPGVTLNPATGAVVVAPGTPAGTYTVTYQICEKLNPTNCDTATATVTVSAAPIDAVNDAPIIVGPSGGNGNLLTNDTLSGAPVTAALVNLTLTNSGGISGLSVDASGNLIVPPNTPPGTYAVTYQICEKLNPTNCDTATVPVIVQGSLTGSVWLDNGGSATGGAGSADRQRNSSEQGLVGWSAEVVYPPGHPQAGQIVTLLDGKPATALTDANGQYQIPGVPPGNYQVRFRSPTGGGQPGAVYGTPTNGEQGNPQGGSTVNSAARTLDVVMPAGAGLAQQSLPVDPSGVVYDSVTRQPIINATVRLMGPNGQPVPDNLLLTGQQNQAVIATGPAAGTYRFDLLPDAPAGVYTIQVTPSAAYTTPSSLIPAQAGAGTPGSGTLCPGAGAGIPCLVQPQPGAPAVGASTTYYLSFNLTPGSSPDVVHNHIPLDPAQTATLAIIKTADKAEAEIGDPVKYTIRVKNLSTTAPVSTITVVDTLPLGFKYVPKTVRGIGTPPPMLSEPAGTPGPQLTFTIATLAPGAESSFSYYVRIGVGGADGDGINRAYAASGTVRSPLAQARVRVSGGVFGADSCVLGKVFVDCGADGVGYGNGNGIQDAGEPGIPGVRLYLQDGTYVITDSEGKYSLCGLAPRTQVLKVDPITLPRGARLGTTANRNAGDPGSLFVDLKNGQLQRADFRDMSCNASVFDEVKRRRDAAPKAEREDVNRARIEGNGWPGSGLGLPTDKPRNTTGPTPAGSQYWHGGKQ